MKTHNETALAIAEQLGASSGQYREELRQAILSALNESARECAAQRDAALAEVKALRGGISDTLMNCGEISDFKEQLDDLLTSI